MIYISPFLIIHFEFSTSTHSLYVNRICILLYFMKITRDTVFDKAFNM